MLKVIRNIKSAHSNTKIIATQTLYAFIFKGIALAISFVSTPLFIKYFNNNEVLGAWYTMLSMLTWFMTFDLGIGNGVRNHLVKSIAAEDRIGIRKIISSGLASSFVISLLITIIGCLIIHYVDLNKIFNISPTIISYEILRTSSYLVFIALMLRFSLSTISAVFYALQKSSINNFLALCISILLFLYILIFRFNNVEESLLNISIAYLIICNLPLCLAGIWVFSTELKDCKPSLVYIRRSATKSIIGIGGIFFSCQLFYLIIANTNEFFISHYWNPLFTADYSFYYRVSMLISLVLSLALTPTWSMVTKAYAEGNFKWLINLYKGFKWTGLLVIILQFSLIPFLQPIMNIWLGYGELQVNFYIALAFACFGASFLYSTMLSAIVCGLGKLKIQFWCYGIGAICKIIFIIIIARYSQDWAWVVWSNVFILVPYCVIQQISLNKLFIYRHQ